MTDTSLATALEPVFQANFEENGDWGASVCVWRDGQELASLHRGYRDRKGEIAWDDETLVPFWSATKGLAATSVLVALADADCDPGEPVRKFWPELELNDLSVGQVLSHQAGLASLDNPTDIHDYAATIETLERQSATPNWIPGTAHGYHPRTFGFLIDELVRRITDAESLGAFWRDRIADPLGLDLWIGLPESEDHRVAELKAASGSPPPESKSFYQAFQLADSLPRRAFGSPKGLHAVSDMNRPEAWRLGLPSMGGIGKASSLARFYSILASSDETVIPAIVREWAQKPLANGMDQVLLMNTAFSAGFMMDPVSEEEGKKRHLFGPSLRAFGHPGAGGSQGFADPEHGIGFAYLMNQMELSVLPTIKAQTLIHAVYEWLNAPIPSPSST